MKYYYREDSGEYDEYCWPLPDFKKRVKEDPEIEIFLHEARRDIGGEMFCKEAQSFIEKGDCGFWACKSYRPTNGRSGRCGHLVNGFIDTERKFKLNKDGLKEIK